MALFRYSRSLSLTLIAQSDSRAVVLLTSESSISGYIIIPPQPYFFYAISKAGVYHPQTSNDYRMGWSTMFEFIIFHQIS